MRARIAAAALAAAIVAIPVAAEAATYTPIAFNSPRGDVQTPSGRTVSMPSIDVTGLSGHRYTGNFQVKAYFADLARTRYARRMVFLLATTEQNGYTKNTVIESRIGSDPNQPMADVISYYSYQSGKAKFVYKRCPGVAASVDYAGNKITYTLPTECYINDDRDSAGLYALTTVHHRSTWRNAPFSETQPDPDAFDSSAADLWRWGMGARGTRTPAMHVDARRFFG